MKISTFIHVFGNRVWDALSKEFLNLSTEDIEFIKKYKDSIILESIPETLKNTNVITTEKDEKELIENLKKYTRDTQFQSLYLITSTACNLDCDYCFYRSSASESLLHRQNMSLDIARQAILTFKRIVENNIKDSDYWQQITLYGGEPLLNEELLYRVIPYIRTLFDNQTSLVINTNATLLSESDIKLFKDYNVEVQVSLDGNQQQHDLHRKTCLGAPTYNIVLNNMKKMLSSGIKVLPMITATDGNIDNFAETLYSIVKELNIDDFAVNILITNSYKIDTQYAEKLASEMLKAYQKYGTIASDYVFVELYQKLLGIDKTISKNSCGSSRKITVFPDGKIYACQALEKVKQNFMGIIQDKFISSECWDCWRDRSRFDNPECLDCECILSCGGGCATGSYNRQGIIYDIDKNNCDYTRKLFKKIHNI